MKVFVVSFPYESGLPCGSADKESTCNVGDLGLIPGLGRSPGEGRVYPLQYSGLENFMAYTVNGVAKSWTQLCVFNLLISPLSVLLLVWSFQNQNLIISLLKTLHRLPMTPLNLQDPHQDITDPLPPGTLSSLHIYIIPSAWNSFPFPASGKPPSAGFCASSRPPSPHLNSLPPLLLCSNLTFHESPYKITPLPFPYPTWFSLWHLYLSRASSMYLHNSIFWTWWATNPSRPQASIEPYLLSGHMCPQWWFSEWGLQTSSIPITWESVGNTASQAPPWNWWVDNPGAGPQGSTGPPADADLSLGIWEEGFSRPEDGSTCLIRVDVNHLAFSPTPFSQGMRCPSAFRTGDSSSCPGISTLSGDEVLLDTWQTGKAHTCQDSWWGAAWNWKEQIDKPLGVGVQPREHSAGAEPGRWPALPVGSGLINFSRLWTFIAKTRNVPGSWGQFVILKPSKNLGECCSHAPHQHSSPLPQLPGSS